MERTQKLQGIQNLPSLLAASHFPEEALDDLTTRVLVKGDANATEQGSNIAHLNIASRAIGTLCYRLIDGRFERIERLQPFLRYPLPFAGTADLLHQA